MNAHATGKRARARKERALKEESDALEDPEFAAGGGGLDDGEQPAAAAVRGPPLPPSLSCLSWLSTAHLVLLVGGAPSGTRRLALRGDCQLSGAIVS